MQNASFPSDMVGPRPCTIDASKAKHANHNPIIYRSEDAALSLLRLTEDPAVHLPLGDLMWEERGLGRGALGREAHSPTRRHQFTESDGPEFERKGRPGNVLLPSRHLIKVRMRLIPCCLSMMTSCRTTDWKKGLEA